jgi:polyferredoxin
MRKLVWLRRSSQVVFLGVFIYALWSTTYPLRGIFSPQVIFKIDPLIMFITALSERVLLPGLVFALVMVLLTAVLGRFFCGWVCPLGTFIDATGTFARQPRKELTLSQRHQFRLPKFFILGAVVLLALFGVQAAWIFDPVVTAARVISLNVIPGLTWAIDQAFQALIQKFGLYGGTYDLYRSLKDGLLGVNVHFFANSFITLAFFLMICLASLRVFRLWCRMLCPLGAWYAVNAKGSWLGRRVKSCTSCGKCVRRCRMGAIDKGVHYDKGECILCMDCVYDCPEKSTEFSFRRAVKE